jgi:hypothetical protein
MQRVNELQQNKEALVPQLWLNKEQVKPNLGMSLPKLINSGARGEDDTFSSNFNETSKFGGTSFARNSRSNGRNKVNSLLDIKHNQDRIDRLNASTRYAQDPTSTDISGPEQSFSKAHSMSREDAQLAKRGKKNMLHISSAMNDSSLANALQLQPGDYRMFGGYESNQHLSGNFSSKMAKKSGLTPSGTKNAKRSFYNMKASLGVANIYPSAQISGPSRTKSTQRVNEEPGTLETSQVSLIQK